MKWEEIKRVREKLGMTQVEVARSVGVSLAAFRVWESGGGLPKAVNLEKLKTVLGVK